MQALVSSDELAKDTNGAETLLERHQEHRTEIDAKSAAFNAFDSFGGQLLARQHFASVEIQDKMSLLKKDRQTMEK
jgi:spectrin alpha